MTMILETAKKFKEEAEKLIHLMNINHTKTRHFSVK